MKIPDTYLLAGLCLLIMACGPGGGAENPQPPGPDEGDTGPEVIAVNSVTLSETSFFLEVEATFALEATVFPPNATERTVSWASTDPGIASVSQEGVVTGISIGDTRITATAGGKSAVCRVSVAGKIVHVLSVSIEQSLTLVEGDKTILTASVLPEDADDRSVSWSIRDGAVASIAANGLSAIVTALSEGITTITVSATDGGISATCILTVTPKPKDADFSQAIYYAYPGMAFTPTVLYSDGSPAPASLWAVSGADYASVSGQGLVSVSGTGTCLIISAVVNGEEISSSVVSEVALDLGASAPVIPGEGVTIAVPMGKESLEFTVKYRDSESTYALIPTAAINSVSIDDTEIAQVSSSSEGWSIVAKSTGSTVLNFTIGGLSYHIPVSVTKSIPSDGPITYPGDDYGTF